MRCLRYVLAGLAVIGLVGVLSMPAPAVETQNDSSNTWNCSLDNIGATLTLCKAGNNGALRLVITHVTAQSTTATAGLMLLRYGTGTNCGTGTTSLYPAAATVARLVYPANTAAPFSPPGLRIEVPTGKDICVIGTATNTVTIHMSGTVGP